MNVRAARTLVRRVAGRQALAHGNALEHRLWFQCEVYKSRGLAKIEKMGTRARAIRVLGKTHFIAQRSPPDFLGCLIEPHRMLVFDAKSTESDRSWRLHADMHHQAEQLAGWAQAGAITFFAVESRPLEALFLVRVKPRAAEEREDWDVVRMDFTKKLGHGQFTSRLRVPADMMGLYDFLPAILKHWATSPRSA